LDIIIPKEYAGVINRELGKRYAALINTIPINDREVEFIESDELMEATPKASACGKKLLAKINTVIFAKTTWQTNRSFFLKSASRGETL